jgi:hypothetical protein
MDYKKILLAINKILQITDKNETITDSNLCIINDAFRNINGLASTSLNDICSYYKDSDIDECDEEIKILEAFIKKYNLDKENIVDIILSHPMEGYYIKQIFINYLLNQDSVDNDNKIEAIIILLKEFLASDKKDKCPFSYMLVKAVIDNIKNDTPIDRKAFRESQELAIIFKELVESFDSVGMRSFKPNKKRVGIMLLTQGLVSSDYEQVIDKDSTEDGLKTIITKLVSIESYGTIRIILNNENSDIDEKDYMRILKYSIEAFPHQTQHYHEDEYKHADKINEYLDNLIGVIFSETKDIEEDSVQGRIQYIKEKINEQ